MDVFLIEVSHILLESLSALISGQPENTETGGNDPAVSEERIRELEDLLKEKNAVIAELETSLADKNREITELQKTVSAETAHETNPDEDPLPAAQVSDPVSEQENTAVPETDPHPARIAELESQVSGLESENASLTVSLAEKAAELDKLSSEVSASSSRISELEAVLSEKDEQILSLSGDCTDKETRIRELEAGLKDSTDTASSLREKTDILSEQVSVLTKDLSAKEAAGFTAGETIETNCNGWTLVRYRGIAAGWGKGTDGMIKNHYPKGLRGSRFIP